MVRQISAAKRLDALQNARLYALVSMAAADAPQPGITTRAQWGADESLRNTAAGCENSPEYAARVRYSIVHHTAHLRSVPLTPEDTEDVVAEILLQIVANDYSVFRNFRGQSTLGTYLTVIARRNGTGVVFEVADRIHVLRLGRRVAVLDPDDVHMDDVVRAMVDLVGKRAKKK